MTDSFCPNLMVLCEIHHTSSRDGNEGYLCVCSGGGERVVCVDRGGGGSGN